MWAQPKLKGTFIPKRAGHTTVVVDKSIFIFGGFSGENVRLNDVSILDYDQLYLHKPIIRGNKRPSPRSYHSAIVVGRRMFIFGGLDGISELDEVWYLDMGSFFPFLLSFSNFFSFHRPKFSFHLFDSFLCLFYDRSIDFPRPGSFAHGEKSSRIASFPFYFLSEE